MTKQAAKGTKHEAAVCAVCEQPIHRDTRRGRRGPWVHNNLRNFVLHVARPQR